MSGGPAVTGRYRVLLRVGVVAIVAVLIVAVLAVVNEALGGELWRAFVDGFNNGMNR